MALRTEELLLVEQRVTNDGKSTGLALLFWILLGLAGAHRFYLRRFWTGIFFLVWFLVSTFMFGIHPIAFAVLLIPLAIVWVIDLFRLPSMVRAANAKMRASLIAEIEAGLRNA